MHTNPYLLVFHLEHFGPPIRNTSRNAQLEDMLVVDHTRTMTMLTHTPWNDSMTSTSRTIGHSSRSVDDPTAPTQRTRTWVNTLSSTVGTMLGEVESILVHQKRNTHSTFVVIPVLISSRDREMVYSGMGWCIPNKLKIENYSWFLIDVTHFFFFHLPIIALIWNCYTLFIIWN